MRAGSGTATGSIGAGVGSGGGVGAAMSSGSGTTLGGGDGGAIQGRGPLGVETTGIVVNSGGLVRIHKKSPPPAPAPKQLRSVNTPKQPAATFAFDIESLLQARAEVVAAG